jgi:hypothetical protein
LLSFPAFWAPFSPSSKRLLGIFFADCEWIHKLSVQDCPWNLLTQKSLYIYILSRHFFWSLSVLLPGLLHNPGAIKVAVSKVQLISSTSMWIPGLSECSQPPPCQKPVFQVRRARTQSLCRMQFLFMFHISIPSVPSPTLWFL